MGNTEKVFSILEKHYENAARTTLNSMREKHSGNRPDAFKILISCLISLRVKDETTEKISDELFKHISRPEELINMDTKKLERIIFSSGYYRNKAKTLKHVSQELLTRFQGRVPEKYNDLISIKGIGSKTANVVLAFAFNKDAIPVDVNVHRIANRLGWVKTKTAEKTLQELEKTLPRKYWREINELFILHGKTICLPLSPYCSICPIRKYCLRVGVLKSR